MSECKRCGGKGKFGYPSVEQGGTFADFTCDACNGTGEVGEVNKAEHTIRPHFAVAGIEEDGTISGVECQCEICHKTITDQSAEIVRLKAENGELRKNIMHPLLWHRCCNGGEIRPYPTALCSLCNPTKCQGVKESFDPLNRINELERYLNSPSTIDTISDLKRLLGECKKYIHHNKDCYEQNQGYKTKCICGTDTLLARIEKEVG